MREKGIPAMNTAPQLANCRKILLTLFVLRLPVRYVAGNHGFAGSQNKLSQPCFAASVPSARSDDVHTMSQMNKTSGE